MSIGSSSHCASVISENDEQSGSRSARSGMFAETPESGIRGSPDELSPLLRPGGHLHDLLLNGVGDELSFVVDVELAHEIELVRLDRLDAETKDACYLAN